MSTVPVPSWPLLLSRAEQSARVAAPPARADIKAINLWERREAELLAIRKYKDDWDGFGAEAPDPTLVDAAVAFLGELRRLDEEFPPMRVTLSPDGFVAMEWQTGDMFLRAELANVTAVEWMVVRPGRETEFHTTELFRSAARPQPTGELNWSANPSTAAGAAAFSDTTWSGRPL